MKKSFYKGEVNVNIYFYRRGWIDGYLNRPMDPYSLGDITEGDAEDYFDGWMEGKDNIRADEAERDRRQRSEAKDPKEESGF